MTKVGANALMPNSALKAFEVLVGEWQTTGRHPYFPCITLHGRASFKWHEGGAFLIIRTEIDHPKFPDGIEILGSDDKAKKFYMLHFDERGVSRKYNVTLKDNRLKWWRDDPDFSQRFTIAIEDDGKRMVGGGEMSRDGGPWEGDLSNTYQKVK